MRHGYVRLYHGTCIAPDVIRRSGLGGYAPTDADIDAECRRHGRTTEELWSVPNVRAYLQREVQERSHLLSVTTSWRNAKNYSRHNGEWRYIVHAGLAALEENSDRSPVLALPGGGFGYSASVAVSTDELASGCTPAERYVVVLDVPLQLAQEANPGNESGLSDGPPDPTWEMFDIASDHVVPAPVPNGWVTRIDRVLEVDCTNCAYGRQAQEPKPLRDGTCILCGEPAAW